MRTLNEVSPIAIHNLLRLENIFDNFRTIIRCISVLSKHNFYSQYSDNTNYWFSVYWMDFSYLSHRWFHSRILLISSSWSSSSTLQAIDPRYVTHIYKVAGPMIYRSLCVSCVGGVLFQRREQDWLNHPSYVIADD